MSKVGYKNPPIASRFRPGRSGNPGGRPKRRPSFGDALLAELAAAMPGTNPDRAGTKLEALVKALVDAAIAGNARTQAIVVGALARIGGADEHESPALTPDDREILDAYVGGELQRRATETDAPKTMIECSTDRADDRRHDADDQQSKKGKQ